MILKVSDVKVRPIYKTFKVGNNFKLNSHPPLLLVSNVVCRFSCPCDAGKAYVGMPSRRLVSMAGNIWTLTTQEKVPLSIICNSINLVLKVKLICTRHLRC